MTLFESSENTIIEFDTTNDSNLPNDGYGCLRFLNNGTLETISGNYDFTVDLNKEKTFKLYRAMRDYFEKGK